MTPLKNITCPFEKEKNLPNLQIVGLVFGGSNLLGLLFLPIHPFKKAPGPRSAKIQESVGEHQRLFEGHLLPSCKKTKHK